MHRTSHVSRSVCAAISLMVWPKKGAQNVCKVDSGKHLCNQEGRCSTVPSCMYNLHAKSLHEWAAHEAQFRCESTSTTLVGEE